MGSGEVGSPGVLVALRALEFVFCLISFSVMAANNNSSAGLYFSSYRGFSFLLAMGVIGFAYVLVALGAALFGMSRGSGVAGGALKAQLYADFMVMLLLFSASCGGAVVVSQLHWATTADTFYGTITASFCGISSATNTFCTMADVSVAFGFVASLFFIASFWLINFAFFD